LKELEYAAAKANFGLSADKKEGPAASITAFNIVVKTDSMQVGEARLDEFIAALQESTSANQRAGIISYVSSVNEDQATELGDKLEKWHPTP
jgi:hypothetical protein